MIQEDQLKRKDPVIQELYQHLRMISQKLDNNLQAIADFKQLLIQSKSEIDAVQKSGKKDSSIATQNFYFQTVLKKIETIMLGFEQAKQSIKEVTSKNSHVKSLLETLEYDLNTLRNKSRRHQI